MKFWNVMRWVALACFALLLALVLLLAGPSSGSSGGQQPRPMPSIPTH